MAANTLTLYGISALMALVPAAIWLTVLFKKSKRRKVQLIIFFGSIFSVVPVFLLHYFLNLFPQFDVLAFLQNAIHDQNLNLILLFISVGIVEELVKQALVRWADRRYLLIHTINDSIRYSLVAALGFAFAENIFYIFTIYTQLGLQQLIIAYLFRSIFTTTAHMLFSGIFGYYYGIAKFSINIVEQEKWTGKSSKFPALVGRLLGISKIQAFKQIMILKGLLLAIIMHAAFNLLLQFNQILPVVIYVVTGFIFLQYKLSQKTGKLILISDSSDQMSSMEKKDEEVVIELLGMWFNKKKYVDVIHICQRLLERDPDNKVIQLFKAKAMDKIDTKSAYGQILTKMFPEQSKNAKTIQDMVNEKILRKQKISTLPNKKKIQIENIPKNNKTEKKKETFNLDLE